MAITAREREKKGQSGMTGSGSISTWLNLPAYNISAVTDVTDALFRPTHDDGLRLSSVRQLSVDSIFKI